MKSSNSCANDIWSWVALTISVVVGIAVIGYFIVGKIILSEPTGLVVLMTLIVTFFLIWAVVIYLILTGDTK